MNSKEKASIVLRVQSHPSLGGFGPTGLRWSPLASQRLDPFNCLCCLMVRDRARTGHASPTWGVLTTVSRELHRRLLSPVLAHPSPGDPGPCSTLPLPWMCLTLDQRRLTR